MTLSLFFWICMLLWLVHGAAPLFKAGERNWSGIGASVLPFLAVCALGYATFGAPIK